jgi:hypothetical protein
MANCPAPAWRAVMFSCLGWLAMLAGCAPSGERAADSPDAPFPRRRGTHGNGSNRN